MLYEFICCAYFLILFFPLLSQLMYRISFIDAILDTSSPRS